VLGSAADEVPVLLCATRFTPISCEVEPDGTKRHRRGQRASTGLNHVGGANTGLQGLRHLRHIRVPCARPNLPRSAGEYASILHEQVQLSCRNEFCKLGKLPIDKRIIMHYTLGVQTSTQTEAPLKGQNTVTEYSSKPSDQIAVVGKIAARTNTTLSAETLAITLVLQTENELKDAKRELRDLITMATEMLTVIDEHGIDAKNPLHRIEDRLVRSATSATVAMARAAGALSMLERVYNAMGPQEE
jgi:hypothetical protein